MPKMLTSEIRARLIANGSINSKREEPQFKALRVKAPAQLSRVNAIMARRAMFSQEVRK